MRESRLWYNKTETKNAKVAKMVEFIKTCDQYRRKFNFHHFFSSIISPVSARGKYKKHCSGKMSNFLDPGVVMTKNGGIILLGDMSKVKEIQFFLTQMHFPVILIP